MADSIGKLKKTAGKDEKSDEKQSNEFEDSSVDNLINKFKHVPNTKVTNPGKYYHPSNQR